MLDIGLLIPTQNSLRHEHQVDQMIEFVSGGGFFTAETLCKHLQSCGKDRPPQLIAVNRFEDGELFLRDGHHRCGSIWLGGRFALREDEYVIEEYTYDQYMEINHDLGWLTPFDPRVEVRRGNFCPFRTEALRISKEQGREAAEVYIRSNRDLYLVDRAVSHNRIDGLFTRFSEPLRV